MLDLDGRVRGPRPLSRGVDCVFSTSHRIGPRIWIINLLGFKIVYIFECVVSFSPEDIRNSLGFERNGKFQLYQTGLNPKFASRIVQARNSNFG